jgi:peptidoglycan-N-acetylglucosamine deacetylase
MGIDMKRPAINNFNFNGFEYVGTTNDVDYVGDGEILDVLNTPHPGKISVELDTTDLIISEQNYVTLPSTYQVRKYGQAPPKQLIITFDDGPDETYTPEILDILSKYHVPAAFFVVGLQAEKNLPILKRIFREGHEIGNHTFTHGNVAKISPDRASIELKLTRLLIESITGHSTILFRAPFNADSEPGTMEEIIPVALARQQNYLDIGESIDPEDWEVGIKADTIVKRVLDGVHKEKGNIILFHDAGGETREETVKALPIIIETLEKEGYSFTNLESILHKTRDELMPPVPKGSGYFIMQFNLVLATIIYWLGNFFYSLFIIFILLGIIRLVTMFVLALRERKKEKQRFSSQDELPIPAPMVSIIVPAYNEEVNAVSSLQNLLNQDYPNFNVIFVDDGSKDASYKKVSEAFSHHQKVKVYTKPNGGKASALNYGIMQTTAEYVVCIDADTKLYPDAISKMMQHFIGKNANTNAGAVAGNVKVGNQVNLLTKWQAIEYITSQNFDRLAYSNINAITVVPGALGAFKKQAIADAGGFTTDTLAEDCDLTIRILRAGYIVENENRAIAVTEAPEYVRQFIKQRTRWSFGVMQTFWKHRDTIFNKNHKGLGFWAMPNILIFQFLIPFFSPLADIFMLFGIFSGNAAKIGFYYAIFMLVDISISVLAFAFEKEKISKLLWIIPQRFAYRWIMYVVLFKSIRKALKGELQHWGILKRTGNVKDVHVLN